MRGLTPIADQREGFLGRRPDLFNADLALLKSGPVKRRSRRVTTEFWRIPFKRRDWMKRARFARVTPSRNGQRNVKNIITG